MSTVSEDIKGQFVGKLQSDPELKKILKGIKESGGDYSDAEKYASRAGQLLTTVFQANISENNFPVGSVKEIAGMIIPAMELNHNAVASVTGLVQKSLNRDGGIGMNAITSEFDRHGALNIVGRMAKYASFEEAKWMLDEPIKTASLTIVDDYLRKNADFQYKSGMRPKIIRICESDACKWCQDLADTYDYAEVKDRNNPVFQRHDNCACEITYEPGDGRVQDVNSKQWIDPEEFEKRIQRSKILKIENNAVYHNNKAIILRDRYNNPNYRFKVLETHRIFADKGWQSTEHFCKRITGRIAQGRIKSIQAVFDVLKQPINYIDQDSHNYVKWYNNIAVVIDSVNGELVTIFATKNKSLSWAKKL